MRIAAVSDLHGKWSKVKIEECDLLISSGDYSFRGEPHMVKDYHSWLNKQPAKYIISVNGNHETFKDNCKGYKAERAELTFQQAKEIAEKACPRVHFIGDHGTVNVEGIKIHGSAITPWFHEWAWNVQRGPDMVAEWAKIPEDTNILVTHGPVYGIHDVVYYPDGIVPKERVGCHDLFDRVMKLPDLKVHICGHIHSGHGYKQFNGKHFYNVSICDEQYMATNPVTIIDY